MESTATSTESQFAILATATAFIIRTPRQKFLQRTILNQNLSPNFHAHRKALEESPHYFWSF